MVICTRFMRAYIPAIPPADAWAEFARCAVLVADLGFDFSYFSRHSWLCSRFCRQLYIQQMSSRRRCRRRRWGDDADFRFQPADDGDRIRPAGGQRALEIGIFLPPLARQQRPAHARVSADHRPLSSSPRHIFVDGAAHAAGLRAALALRLPLVFSRAAQQTCCFGVRTISPPTMRRARRRLLYRRRCRREDVINI